jgi:ribosomal protein L22
MSDERRDSEAQEKPKRRRRSARAKAGAAGEAGASAEEQPAERKPARRSRARKAAGPPREKVEAARAEAQAEEAKVEEAGAEPAEPAEPEEARPAEPAPARKRAPDEPPPAPPLVRARARYVRSSPRKARLVCEHIRGKSVDEARAILRYTPRAVAEDWTKLLESAVANAEHNHELVGDELRVVEAYADEGPTLKRYRPRAFGRATRIRKRTTHLTITLTPKEND